MKRVCAMCGGEFASKAARCSTCPGCAVACTICGGPHKSLGLCRAHHQRWLRAGKPDVADFASRVRAGEPLGLMVRECAECGQPFNPYSDQATCSEECRRERKRRQWREFALDKYHQNRDEFLAQRRQQRQDEPLKFRRWDRNKRQREREQNPIVSICRRCGREFSAKRKDARWCSDECASSQVEQDCQLCGKPFVGLRRAKYCSSRCSRQAFVERRRADKRAVSMDDMALASLALSSRLDGVTPDEPAPAYLLDCHECGQQFGSNQANTRYCSRRCRNKQHARRRLNKRQRQSTAVTLPKITCVICNDEFQPDRRNAKTCSQWCRNRYKVQLEQKRHEQASVRERAKLLARDRHGVTARCIICDKDMTDLPDLRQNRYTCSADCRREAMRRRNRRSYLRRTNREEEVQQQQGRH